jgi:hypothetical protein
MKRDGLGLLKTAEGIKIEGTWASGILRGKANVVFPNGDIYQGEWVEGKRHGKGRDYRASTEEVFEV